MQGEDGRNRPEEDHARHGHDEQEYPERVSGKEFTRRRTERLGLENGGHADESQQMPDADCERDGFESGRTHSSPVARLVIGGIRSSHT